jgi:hypothetical protein
MKRPYLLTLSLLILTIQITTAGKGNNTLYLPFVTSTLDCNIANTNYSTIPMIPPPTGRPAEVHADLNLALRSYEPTTADLNLIEYPGGTDPNAPQLDDLFADKRVPTFTTAYQVHHWDWNCNCQSDVITDPPVTHLGMAVAPGEVIHVPDSGYNIGGDNDVHILYANDNRITLKYTGEDNVISGYTIHIENVCVEPDLLALYETWNADGRSELPALPGNTPLGRALSSEISISIRDNGAFLDPRSRKDWWQDH